MSKKQIIINGVDVLKEKINMCFILLTHKLETSETIEQTIYDHLDVFVEEWNNQLKRKEQECEELKGKLKYIRDENVHLKESATDEQMDFLALNNYIRTLEFQIDQLKAENEELKKQLMQKSEIDMFFNTPLEGWSSNPCDICRYKQTLIEIKGIAEENIRIADLEGLIGIYRGGLAEQILQKISVCEVKNVNS